jgi:hypothetical protein
MEFVCWLHGIASRKAVRRARPAWIEASKVPDTDEPPLAFAQTVPETPEETEGWEAMFARNGASTLQKVTTLALVVAVGIALVSRA